MEVLVGGLLTIQKVVTVLPGSRVFRELSITPRRMSSTIPS
jgi:hypothetical protein